MNKLRTLLTILLLSMSAAAQAAKMTVSWTNPTENTDGSALVNLASVTVQWGNCSTYSIATGATTGTGVVGVVQSQVVVSTNTAGANVSTAITPSGISPVCVWAQATNNIGETSAWSAVVSAIPLAAPGQPETPGQPEQLSGMVIHLNFTPKRIQSHGIS